MCRSANWPNGHPTWAGRDQPIVVVCKTDRRSARAAADLLAAGLTEVAVLRGGTDGWHQRGLALE
jgi:rhodanese-related sulfurtransferase